MTNRPVIDQAIGFLMSRSGIAAGDAFDRLRQLSQRENTEMSAVAAGIVPEAVRRDRARHWKKRLSTSTPRRNDIGRAPMVVRRCRRHWIVDSVGCFGRER